MKTLRVRGHTTQAVSSIEEHTRTICCSGVLEITVCEHEHHPMETTEDGRAVATGTVRYVPPVSGQAWSPT